MHCDNCGNLLPPRARVCPNCGTPVPTNVPSSPSNVPPPEQTGYGNFGPFQEAGPPIPNAPVNVDKTVQQGPPAPPQAPYPGGYSMPGAQEQFQFPAQSSFSPDQSIQPGQPYQPYQPSPPQQPPFAGYMPPQQQSYPGAVPQQSFPGMPPQQYSDTTQQNIPASNPPLYPGMPPQQSPFAGQAGQFGQPGPQGQFGQASQMGQPEQPAQFGQAGQPVQQWQQAQPAPRRRSTGLIIALIAAIVLIIAGSSLVYYLGVARPAQLHAQATATVVTRLTSQARGTAIANTHATGTAQAQANATTTAVAVATAQVQATMTAYVSMYTQATNGTPALNDPLTQNDSNNWNTYSSNGANCGFANGSLQATGQGGLCFADATNFGDLAFQAKVNIVKGSATTAGGLMFRLDHTTLKFYVFGIDTNGNYFLALLQVVSNKTTFKNLTGGSSSALTTGFNTSNTLAILARGSNFYLYANKQYITQFSDSNSAAGSIGLFGSDSNNGVDVSFSNAEVWRA